MPDPPPLTDAQRRVFARFKVEPGSLGWRTLDVECPVIMRSEGRDVVILPDGSVQSI